MTSKVHERVSSDGKHVLGAGTVIVSEVENGCRLAGWERFVKRGMDFLLSLMAMPFLGIFYVIVGTAIKLDSKGPVLFAQTRIGKDGKAFQIYKFRSMIVDADKHKSDLDSLNESEGPTFKIKKDPRITRVGAIIRRTSIDELPQLINVLKGDMSLVGPRPPLPGEVANYTERQRLRLSVVPGLTCLWQIKGRSNLSFEQWVELDLIYIRNQSLLLDLKILVLTIPAVLKGSGAW